MKSGLSFLSTTFVLISLSACQTTTPPAAQDKQTPVAVAAAPAAPAHAAPASEPAKPVPVEAARNIANNCFTCHGPNGRSPGTIPSLSRMSAPRMANLLKDFKSGAEPSTVMGRHAKAYTDAELEAVATYIASVNQ